MASTPSVQPSHITGKRVLVTGGAGFLGKAVCREIEKLRPASLFVPRRAKTDLCELQSVREMLDEQRPQTVLHLAAEVGGIGANRENPGRFFYANAVMGIHLMEESRRRGVEKYLQVGTVCSYPKVTPVPFQERSLWEGYPEETNAPYGVAKKALIVQAEAYRQQYGFNAVTVIPVNLYGPNDNFDLHSSHVIPALIRKALEAVVRGQPTLEVWGSGSASREFLYVDDAARGIVMACERYEKSDPVNLGAGREIKIRDLVETICRLVGFTGRIVWDASKPDGQPRRCLDTSKAYEEFGFKASVDFVEGLRRTITWYQSQVAPARRAA